MSKQKKESIEITTSTNIYKCTCEHEYQDSIYGKGMRLHTRISEKGKNPNRFRCTVCGNEKR